MNRFKKTMALTAACVIAATTVNVGSVAFASGDSPSGTPQGRTEAASSGAVVPAKKTEIKITGVAQKDGVANKSDTKKLEINFAQEPVGVTYQHIKVEKATVLKEGFENLGNKITVSIKLDASVIQGEKLTVTVTDTDTNSFSADEENNKVAVHREKAPVQIEVMSATVEDGNNKKILVTLKEKVVHTVPASAKNAFTVLKNNKKAEIKAVKKDDSNNKIIEIELMNSVQYNEELTLTYDPSALEFENKIKVVNEDTTASGFTTEVTNNVEAAHLYKVTDIKALDGIENKVTTTKIQVTFAEDAANLKPENFVLDGATVKSATVQANTDHKVYILEIEDVSKTTLTLSTRTPGWKFEGAKLTVSVHMKPVPSTGGGGGRSSVRPDSSAPAKKEDAKKDEMKNEPKKDEMKKDEMSNATSTDKVSTKLVIGQKTYTAMVNGQAVEKTMDVAPMVHQGRTVLPARMISELLGVDVKFDQKSKTANFMYGEAKVQLTLGQKFMLVNGEKVALTADILNKDGRILLPVTDIQKAFAKLGLTANVSWDAATKSVTIEK